jgi:branched-subunit amino acid transport protein AzlD
VNELIGVAVTVAIHLWRGNTLLSIGIGTIAYMVLVQGKFF